MIIFGHLIVLPIKMFQAQVETGQTFVGVCLKNMFEKLSTHVTIMMIIIIVVVVVITFLFIYFVSQGNPGEYLHFVSYMITREVVIGKK